MISCYDLDQLRILILGKHSLPSSGNLAKLFEQCGSVTHQMSVPVPSISCCVLNHHNLVYQIQNALVFNQDTCCHLALCLRLLPLHCSPPPFISPRPTGLSGLAFLITKYSRHPSFKIDCI